MQWTDYPHTSHDHVRAHYAARVTAPRTKFTADFAEVLTDWRLGIIPPRLNWSKEQELFRSGVAELAGLRLRIAYMPLFQGLERIQARIKIIETVYGRADPYAPAPSPCKIPTR